jgi:cell division protein ZapB
MGLDFIQEKQYFSAPFEGDAAVDSELFEKLEQKINDLVTRYTEIKEENHILTEENRRMQQEREGLKGRIDGLLNKLEGV